MSYGETIPLLTFAGVVAVVVAIAVIVLIKTAMRQAAQLALEKQRADQNAQTVEQIKKTTDIIIAPLSDDELDRRLRGGDF